jgi:hypothetical protein
VVVEVVEDDVSIEVIFEEDVVCIEIEDDLEELEDDLDDVIFEDVVRNDVIFVEALRDVVVDVLDEECFDTIKTLLGAHVNPLPVTGKQFDRIPYEYCRLPPDLLGEEEYVASLLF